MKIIGRKYELKQLAKAIESPNAELIAVTGRRRVGKTFLIKEYFNGIFDFYATGVFEGKQKDELRAFSDMLIEKGIRKSGEIKDWMDAFVALRDFLKRSRKKRLIVFLDELPWFDVPPGHFLKAFEWFWNSWASTRKGLKLIVCGSATSWMIDNFIHSKGGLYNRTTLNLHLAPFNLHDVRQLLLHNGMDFDDGLVLEAYMVFGGIPYYINMLQKELSLDANIDRLFFSENAPLRNEYEFLFRSLFRNSQNYLKVVNALAGRNCGVTREEIVKLTDIPNGGGLTTVLNNLERCDFIRRYDAFGNKKKGALFQLTDLFILFFKRFVETYNGWDSSYWLNMIDNPRRRSWGGIAFEQVCLLHLNQIKEALGIKGVQVDAGGWWNRGDAHNKGIQIDLLLKRRDRVINLCEMKYCGEPFSMTKQYSVELRNRKMIFKEITATHDAVHLTLVSPWGLKQNAYSSIFNQTVTLNDLLKN